MGQILTESMLRSARLAQGQKEYHVPPEMVVTPLAVEYLNDRKIRLVRDRFQPMSMQAKPQDDPFRFHDAKTGSGMEEKPEHMTHLRGNLLVPKTDPQIAFRGSLDLLHAEILLLQCTANEQGLPALGSDLGDLRALVQAVLGAEVRDAALEPVRLFGLDDAEIREMSHNVKKHFGMPHPVPEVSMGRAALELNRLRAEIRQSELAAAGAFIHGDQIARPDLIRAMNRMSSGAYILFCRVLSGYYEKDGLTNGS